MRSSNRAGEVYSGVDRPAQRKGVMKRLFGILVAATFVAVSAVEAQTLSQAELDRGVQYLESTKKGLVEATRGLSDAQLNFKASPFRWSIAQAMEHIATTEDLLRQLAEEQMKKAPPVPDRDLKKTDDMVVQVIPDRSRKFQAPEQLRPTNAYGSPEGSMKHFLESRAKTVALLKNTPDLRAHAADSGLFGKIDVYQRILFISAHCERHTTQILEVKADPKFPK